MRQVLFVLGVALQTGNLLILHSAEGAKTAKNAARGTKMVHGLLEKQQLLEKQHNANIHKKGPGAEAAAHIAQLHTVLGESRFQVLDQWARKKILPSVGYAQMQKGKK